MRGICYNIGKKGCVSLITRLRPKNCAVALLGSAILAFGLYNVHSLSGVTEGGVLGLTLLLEYWFGLSPAVSGLVMNLACYLLAGMDEAWEALRFFTPLTLYNPMALSEGTAHLWMVAALAGAALVLYGLGTAIFCRRNLSL